VASIDVTPETPMTVTVRAAPRGRSTSAPSTINASMLRPRWSGTWGAAWIRLAVTTRHRSPSAKKFGTNSATSLTSGPPHSCARKTAKHAAVMAQVARSGRRRWPVRSIAAIRASWAAPPGSSAMRCDSAVTRFSGPPVCANMLRLRMYTERLVPIHTAWFDVVRWVMSA
jgi:hypothetical protein